MVLGHTDRKMASKWYNISRKEANSTKHLLALYTAYLREAVNVYNWVWFIYTVKLISCQTDECVEYQLLNGEKRHEMHISTNHNYYQMLILKCPP